MLKILALTILFALTAAAAADVAAGSADVRIGLSPSGEKSAKLDANLEICRKILTANSEAAQEKWAELSAAERNDALAGVAWSKDDPKLRERAVRMLARQSPSDDKDANGLKALASVAVAEGDGTLRNVARKALAARDDKRTADLLVGAMQIDDPLIKSNTIEAMKDIGGKRVFEVIIEHWKEFWGPSARDHVFIGTVRSYIGDYDISGNSYDPVVRSFMTGVVLDAKVLKVEADIYYVWIREITGDRKLPNDPLAWERWMKKSEPELAKKAAALKAAAIEFFKTEP